MTMALTRIAQHANNNAVVQLERPPSRQKPPPEALHLWSPEESRNTLMGLSGVIKESQILGKECGFGGWDWLPTISFWEGVRIWRMRRYLLDSP